MASEKKIVVIGGGTGTYQTLVGLKKYPLNLSAVISMCDTGGSTGRLRKELGVLPPGDVRRAILALSDLPFAQRTLEELFNFRFKKGEGLRNHSVGNILLAALTQITGSMDKAIDEAARILHTSGTVYPVTLDKTNLVAILEDGTRIFGETNIDRRKIKPKLKIKNIYLSPKAGVFAKTAEVLKDADLIVLAPGDLYTSVVPVLLVDGVIDAISKSKAKIAYVVNLMTKKGETDGFKADDYVKTIESYLDGSLDKLKYILVNRKVNHSKSKISRWYKKYGSIPVENNLGESKNYRIITKDFVSTTTFFRHDPDKIARAIISLV